LGEKIRFPFNAKCMCGGEISPLRVDEIVQAIGTVDEYDCIAEMFVKIEWAGRSLGVPLAQLKGIEVDSETEEAIADWRYWVDRRHMLCR
jgi:hypothetical protein